MWESLERCVSSLAAQGQPWGFLGLGFSSKTAKAEVVEFAVRPSGHRNDINRLLPMGGQESGILLQGEKRGEYGMAMKNQQV